MNAQQTTRRLVTTALAAALLGSAGVAGAGAGQAAPQQPAAASAGVLGSTSIDMDGDGRADRTTLTKVRRTYDHYTLRLTTRTAKGRTISTLVQAPGYMDDTHAKNIWVGAAGIDGVKGGEVVLDLNGGFGDSTGQVVYTMRKGKYQTLRAPGAKSDRTYWNVQYFPGVEAGYEFSTAGGVRRVTATVFTSVKTDADHRVISSSGFRTSYRWGSKGWMKSRTVYLKDVPPKQTAAYAGWHGLIWR